MGVLLVSVLALAVPGHDAAAQQGQGQGQYITEAAARLSKLISSANKDGFTLQDNNFSIGGGWLKKDTDKWVPLFTLTLQAGKKYRFLASGDADARDVDLQVQDLNGKTLASDEDTAADAIVNFTPAATQKYLVRVRLYASDQNVPCVCLAVVMSAK
jgi:hypothetical protein